ncbi:hypothetical protein HMPREF9294_1642 [Porphyromonas asaccharolytica PR426713P-I]|uniref:DUF4276 family protein n=1 Tax=Porphyromonas asaccharolytica TaxID=28123 RepID=UPI0001EB1FED|nr:DUF4276 family protein [Porphyromonas asaccharolytica]EFR35172.1 hypothetical protein HMPREF9294_1642 [Porphyromonas asaccharolytica PR426713P-I]
MKDIYLYVLCEGESEMQLVKTTLHPYLESMAKDIHLIIKRINLKGRINWDKIRKDLNNANQIANREHQKAYFTTMIDFYALPTDFPGNEGAKDRNHKGVVTSIEKAMSEMGKVDNFIPYVQLHEFEALVFCDIDLLTEHFELSEKARESLEKIVKDFHRNPEDINRKPSTAPSKRLDKAFQEDGKRKYPKVLVAGEIPQIIGIPKFKEMCPHFAEWVSKLECLVR